jgi:hypothetical protein
MRFALIDNVRFEAMPGLKGLCPGCLQPVIAKCGQQKINHWAHRSKRTCDNWWEPETDWHRSWKNNFPAEWQEIFLLDEQNNKKHVADIKSPYGLVIEFQHSHIKPEERISREKFYKKMVWVVDCTRLKNTYKRFLKMKNDCFRQSPVKDVFYVSWPDECFPKEWLNSSVPVVFDFLGMQSPNEPNDPERNSLWYLFPERAEGTTVIYKLSREYFIDSAKSDPDLYISSPHIIIGNFNSIIRQKRMQEQSRLPNRMFYRQRRFRF